MTSEPRIGNGSASFDDLGGGASRALERQGGAAGLISILAQNERQDGDILIVREAAGSGQRHVLRDVREESADRRRRRAGLRLEACARKSRSGSALQSRAMALGARFMKNLECRTLLIRKRIRFSLRDW